MNGENRLLLEKLIELAENRVHLPCPELDEAKARFMMMLSSSAETIAELERLGYQPIQEGDDDEESERTDGRAIASKP